MAVLPGLVLAAIGVAAGGIIGTVALAPGLAQARGVEPARDVVLSAGVVRAPGGQVSTTPADGAALTTAPHEIDLTFTATPVADLSHVSVRDDHQTSLTSGELSLVGRDTVRQPVSITGSGNITVAYHVVFTDGADTLGFLQFSVGTGVAPPPLGAQAQRAAAAKVQQHEHGIDALSATLLVADAAVLLGVALLLLRRPARPREGVAATPDT